MKSRKFVDQMAEAMEGRLRVNDHKEGGWDSLADVLVKLLEEVHELALEAASGRDDFDTLIDEAADVANVAGMVVSYCSSQMSDPNDRSQFGAKPRSERPPEDQNFCRVFEMPADVPECYCFGGGRTVEVRMVDWFQPWPHPACEEKVDTWELLEPLLRKYILEKVYIKKGSRYVVVTECGRSIVVDG